MSDCFNEAKNLRLRQLELALSEDFRTFDIAEIRELCRILEENYSGAVDAEQLNMLKERHRFTLAKNDSGSVSCRIFSSSSSKADSKAEIQLLLQKKQWPFALYDPKKINDRTSPVIKLKQSKVIDFALIANELSRLMKKEWTPTLRCDAATAQLLSASGGQEDIEGVIFREQDKYGMPYPNAVFIGSRIVGAMLKLTPYYLFLPDQFVAIPKFSVAVDAQTSNVSFKSGPTPEDNFISQLQDCCKPETLLPSAAALFEEQFIATVNEQIKKLVGVEIQAL